MTHWGPLYWYVLHSITFYYDKKNIDLTFNIIKFFHIIIPTCGNCFNKDDDKLFNLSFDIIDKMSSYELFKWSIDIHNEINKKLNKKIFDDESATINIQQLDIDKLYQAFLGFIIMNIPIKNILQNNEKEIHLQNLICKLCQLFYNITDNISYIILIRNLYQYENLIRIRRNDIIDFFHIHEYLVKGSQYFIRNNIIS